MSLRVDVALQREGFSLEAAFDASVDETVALLGPNGSGKSTVVSILAGLIRPDSGHVELDGIRLDDVPPEERPVGVLFQDLLLFPHLSALENVAFPLRARGAAKVGARRRAAEALERFGMAGRAGARPRDLSGGEAQRVALARTLITEPRLLLLDEPTSSLDVAARARFRRLLSETLRTFPGVRVLVSHDPVEAMTLADRLVVLEDGRVTQAGTPEDFRRAPRTPYAAELVGVNLFAGRLERLPDGAGRLVAAGGELTVAWPPQASDPTEDVLAVLRPADVSLHRECPEGSARNVFHGRIEEIAVEGTRARVRLGTHPALVAEVTLGSVSRLGLAEGTAAWASFKAVEVAVLLPQGTSTGTLVG
ncbi:MAG: ABC transporter ATP-binding protein [Actinobacteria bacterium]|nr:ABC transporter ATP-binding protein [Actinomycetota bacterium]